MGGHPSRRIALRRSSRVAEMNITESRHEEDKNTKRTSSVLFLTKFSASVSAGRASTIRSNSSSSSSPLVVFYHFNRGSTFCSIVQRFCFPPRSSSIFFFYYSWRSIPNGTYLQLQLCCLYSHFLLQRLAATITASSKLFCIVLRMKMGWERPRVIKAVVGDEYHRIAQGAWCCGTGKMQIESFQGSLLRTPNNSFSLFANCLLTNCISSGAEML